MIIGIDVSSIPYSTGVSNYTLNLVNNLLKIDKENTYKLFYSSFRQPLPQSVLAFKKYPHVKIYQFKLPPTLLDIFWNQWHILPIEFFIGKVDIFHTWDWLEPPILFGKKVTTVHDLVPFLYPKWQHSRTIATHKKRMHWVVKESKGIVSVSENTKKDLLALFPTINPNKITVIYQAPEQKYFEFNHQSEQEKNAKIKKLKKAFNLDRYLLAQGTLEPRKNIGRLIKAFYKFKNKYPTSKVELAIAGKYGWGGDTSKYKHPSIKILGYIPEKEMVPLHASALALVYPSLYEGFGLPIIKSMALGVPVITSNTSSMAEIADNCAILIEPKSINSIYQAIEKICTDSKLRHRLSVKCFANSKKFNWKNSAKLTLSFYQKINDN